MATDLRISLNWRMRMWNSFARFAAGMIARAEQREPDFVIGESSAPYLRRKAEREARLAQLQNAHPREERA